MDVRNREVYKRVSAGTLGHGAEMKGGAGNHVNTARVCVYTCVRVCTWFTFSRRTLCSCGVPYALPAFTQHKRITSCSFSGV